MIFTLYSNRYYKNVIPNKYLNLEIIWSLQEDV